MTEQKMYDKELSLDDRLLEIHQLMTTTYELIKVASKNIKHLGSKHYLLKYAYSKLEICQRIINDRYVQEIKREVTTDNKTSNMSTFRK